MAYVLFVTKVEDYAKWKPIFDEDSPNRKAGGSQGGQLFRNAHDPNEVVILFEWDSLHKALQFSQSPVLQEKMRQSGVLGQPEIYFLDKVEDIDGR